MKGTEKSNHDYYNYVSFQQPEVPKSFTAGADSHQHVCLLSPSSSREPGPLDPDVPWRAQLRLIPKPAWHGGITPCDCKHWWLSRVHMELYATEMNCRKYWLYIWSLKIWTSRTHIAAIYIHIYFIDHVHTFFVAISIEEIMVEEAVWDWENQLSPQQQQSLEATDHHPGCEDKSGSLMVSVQSPKPAERNVIGVAPKSTVE